MVGAIGLATEGRMKRITALDPAGFMFHTVPPEERIDASDAEIVDVIHTAGLWVGTDGVVGDIDFYPNGGTAKQAGCEDENFQLACSHSRASALTWASWLWSVDPWRTLRPVCATMAQPI